MKKEQTKNKSYSENCSDIKIGLYNKSLHKNMYITYYVKVF